MGNYGSMLHEMELKMNARKKWQVQKNGRKMSGDFHPRKIDTKKRNITDDCKNTTSGDGCWTDTIEWMKSENRWADLMLLLFTHIMSIWSVFYLLFRQHNSYYYVEN